MVKTIALARKTNTFAQVLFLFLDAFNILPSLTRHKSQGGGESYDRLLVQVYYVISLNVEFRNNIC